jgi:hypothetical protein
MRAIRVLYRTDEVRRKLLLATAATAAAAAARAISIQKEQIKSNVLVRAASAQNEQLALQTKPRIRCEHRVVFEHEEKVDACVPKGVHPHAVRRYAERNFPRAQRSSIKRVLLLGLLPLRKLLHFARGKQRHSLFAVTCGHDAPRVNARTRATGAFARCTPVRAMWQVYNDGGASRNRRSCCCSQTNQARRCRQVLLLLPLL